jgi:phospholipase C
MVINFREWGGFFDHAPPPLVEPPPADAALGVMVGWASSPVVISPWSKRGVVEHSVYDHTWC